MSLSDKIGIIRGMECLDIKDVKEFIKELKEQFPNAHPIIREINRLAGDKLI